MPAASMYSTRRANQARAYLLLQPSGGPAKRARPIRGAAGSWHTRALSNRSRSNGFQKDSLARDLNCTKRHGLVIGR